MHMNVDGSVQTRDKCTFFLLFVRWSKTGREKMCKQGKNVQTRTKSGDSRLPKKETDKIKKGPSRIRTRLTERPPGPEWRWPTLPEYHRVCTTGIGNPYLKYCFQSSKGLVQVRVPLFWFGPLGLGSGFVRERVPVQVRLRTQTPRGGGFSSNQQSCRT